MTSNSTSSYEAPHMKVIEFDKRDVVCFSGFEVVTPGGGVIGGGDVEEGGDLPPWGEND